MALSVGRCGSECVEYSINSILGKEVTVYGNPYVFRSLQDELIKFIKLYVKGLEDENDDEMLELTLKTILAMRKKGKTEVYPV